MGILVLCDEVGSYAVTSDGGLLPTHPHPFSLPVVREKVSLIVATMCISHPTTSCYNSPFLHFNPTKLQATQPSQQFYFFFVLSLIHSSIHSLIYLFNKLGADCLPGTLLGARNRMESKTRYHACLPEAYDLTGETEINQVITDMRV